MNFFTDKNWEVLKGKRKGLEKILQYMHKHRHRPLKGNQYSKKIINPTGRIKGMGHLNGPLKEGIQIADKHVKRYQFQY